MYLQLLGVFVTLFQIVITEKCITPNNEEAECVPITSCEILIDAVYKAEQSDINEFVRKSKCGGGESDRMVCCGSTSRFSAPMINKTADKDKLLPDRTYCGYQHSDDYFRDDTAIGINEFPWLAVLIHKNISVNGYYLKCLGSLISNRYVLTSAYCMIDVEGVVGVRLGEYNITADEDCTEDSGFYECSEPPQTVDVEKIIPHPLYNKGDVNDIGLLRLSKRVLYSDYIRPICLPTAGTRFAKPGDILLTPSWLRGIKRKIYSKLITQEECGKYIISQVYNINENVICTKDDGRNTEATCLQPDGAPLIFSYRNQWHQEGISRHNHVFCHDWVHPVLFTKVVNYLDWIKENIEP